MNMEVDNEMFDLVESQLFRYCMNHQQHITNSVSAWLDYFCNNNNNNDMYKVFAK